MFFFLDCYYLSVERNIIKCQNQFITNLKNGGVEYIEMLYRVNSSYLKRTGFNTNKLMHQIKSCFGAMLSISTTPFYILLLTLIVLFSIPLNA